MLNKPRMQSVKPEIGNAYNTGRCCGTKMLLTLRKHT